MSAEDEGPMPVGTRVRLRSVPSMVGTVAQRMSGDRPVPEFRGERLVAWDERMSSPRLIEELELVPRSLDEWVGLRVGYQGQTGVVVHALALPSDEQFVVVTAVNAPSFGIAQRYPAVWPLDNVEVLS